MVNLPEMVKPAIHDEEMCICNRGNDRGEWGERMSKEQKGKPGEAR